MSQRKRVEKRWKPEYGYGEGVTLSCGHFFGGEHSFKSREHVACPVCPDRSREAMNRVYRIDALEQQLEGAGQ